MIVYAPIIAQNKEINKNMLKAHGTDAITNTREIETNPIRNFFRLITRHQQPFPGFQDTVRLDIVI